MRSALAGGGPQFVNQSMAEPGSTRCADRDVWRLEPSTSTRIRARVAGRAGQGERGRCAAG